MFFRSNLFADKRGDDRIADDGAKGDDEEAPRLDQSRSSAEYFSIFRIVSGSSQTSDLISESLNCITSTIIPLLADFRIVSQIIHRPSLPEHNSERDVDIRSEDNQEKERVRPRNPEIIRGSNFNNLAFTTIRTMHNNKSPR